jgi:hypothetical protein
MADDADMRIKRDPSAVDESFGKIAKEEFALSAKAFFAPIVGAMWVMREILSSDDVGSAPAPAAPRSRRPAAKEHERDAA